MRLPVTAPARLLMTADAVGGVWTYVLDLAHGLVPHGVQTTIVVLGPEPSPAQLARARAVPGLAVLVTGLPLDWAVTSPRDVEETSHALASLAARLEPDLVQVNSAPLASTGVFRAPLVVACHSCVTTWWRAVKGAREMPPEFRWRAELTARALERADALLAPSASFAVATTEAYGLPQWPRVAHNGRAPLAHVTTEQAPAGYVMTAGRLWDEGKNVAQLDRVAARLGAPIIAAGPLSGPNGAVARFERLCTPGALSPNDVAALLIERPVFVSTSCYEPFGLAVLEAAQAGCALVLSDIPTFRELWNGVAAFVQPDDDDALARTLRGLLGDTAQRLRLGAAARERARRYSIPAMVKATLSAWGFPSAVAPTSGAESAA